MSDSTIIHRELFRSYVHIPLLVLLYFNACD